MSDGRFGIHGGQYIPETLMNEIINLENSTIIIKNDPEFCQELDDLLEKLRGPPVPSLLRRENDKGSRRSQKFTSNERI